MENFIAIDSETGNPKRVSACTIGRAKVSKLETGLFSYLVTI